MKIQLTSVVVDDQDKLLKVYVEVLGYVKKQDILDDDESLRAYFKTQKFVICYSAGVGIGQL